MSAEQPMRQIAYAIYFLPGDDEMQLITGAAEQVDSLLEGVGLKSGFVFAPYEESEAYPKLLIRSQALIRGEECIKSSFAAMPLPENTGAALVPMDRAAYEGAVDQVVLDLTADADFSKAVIARTRQVTLAEDFSALQMLKQLKDKMPQAFCFLVITPQAGMWIGATPERLIEVKNGLGFTNALAGTLPAKGHFQWSEKEITEQQIVTDYIAGKLENEAQLSYKKGDVNTIVSGTVKHLKTIFEFNIGSDEDLTKVVDVLHPTPAVCGMPLAKAKAAIAKYESSSREYYTGYLGPIGIGDESYLFVNLRSMKVEKGQATLFVGAGITADSVPEKEWEETEVKAQTLLNVL